MNHGSTTSNHKNLALMIGLGLCAFCISFAQTERAIYDPDISVLSPSFTHHSNSRKSPIRSGKSAFPFGNRGSLSDRFLSEISEKSIPVNLPNVSRNIPSVVLWDELRTRTGGGGRSMECGEANNLQSYNVATSR